MFYPTIFLVYWVCIHAASGSCRMYPCEIRGPLVPCSSLVCVCFEEGIRQEDQEANWLGSLFGSDFFLFQTGFIYDLSDI